MLNSFRIRTLGIGFATTALLITTLGCSGKQESTSAKQEAAKQESPIVKKAEASGAGDLSNTSVAAMTVWFTNHLEVAQDIRKECEPVQTQAPASWSDSTEGHVCQAAAEATAPQFPPSEHGPGAMPRGPKSMPPH